VSDYLRTKRGFQRVSFSVSVLVFLLIHVAHICVIGLISSSRVAFYRDTIVRFGVKLKIPREIKAQTKLIVVTYETE
jgi:hypothetical protein